MPRDDTIRIHAIAVDGLPNMDELTENCLIAHLDDFVLNAQNTLHNGLYDPYSPLGLHPAVLLSWRLRFSIDGVGEVLKGPGSSGKRAHQPKDMNAMNRDFGGSLSSTPNPG